MCLSQRSMQLSFKAPHLNRFLPNPCTCVFISNSVCALLSVKLTVQIICFRPHKTWICLLYQLNRFLSNFPSLENNAINQNYIANYEGINLLDTSCVKPVQLLTCSVLWAIPHLLLSSAPPYSPFLLY